MIRSGLLGAAFIALAILCGRTPIQASGPKPVVEIGVVSYELGVPEDNTFPCGCHTMILYSFDNMPQSIPGGSHAAELVTVVWEVGGTGNNPWVQYGQTQDMWVDAESGYSHSTVRLFLPAGVTAPCYGRVRAEVDYYWTNFINEPSHDQVVSPWVYFTVIDP